MFRDDELGRLADRFNFMAESLATSYASLERKVAERTKQLQAIQDQLIRAEKISAMGLLVGGVAHELNNPLAAIMGAAELARMEAEATPSGLTDAGLLEQIVVQAERCRRIVGNLLQFARQQEPKLAVVALNTTVEQVLALREYELRTRNISIAREFDPANPKLCADPDKIEQVVLNLLNNAHDAIAETGRPGTIRVRTAAQGDHVLLEFLDDGPGFRDPERVFDPFYTTKPVGKGTGLGLSVCYGIVNEHSGDIVASNAEGGARVVVTLPVGDLATVDRSGAEVPGPPPGPLARRHRVALVVDDEPALVRLQLAFLARMGIDGVGAETGHEALRVLQTRQIDLVVSDVRMPGGIDGLQLYDWVRACQPALADRFVFASGDLVGFEGGDVSDPTNALRVRKPFRFVEFERVVRMALAREGAAS